ncbi:methyl-accepting chemotaxis protein [Clostridium sp. SYSU_GA19001]|uniref:methyl-accepting chemotaxis protein n=1 Tax=Clostridium caldaquaticum TaxID=2940653 RepID=UPI0020779B19|nr:methyl-accepting chemotaxis protein [Clostridium caldaquaticum]MCM8711720.1 methyl-accepting chemotaxis protein [Clostridium caldaquaticum]
MNNNIFDNEVLNSFNMVLPYLKNMFDEDVAFGISNTDIFLKVQQGKTLVLKSKEGDKIPSGGAVHKAIQSGEIIVADVPKEVYGVPFRSYAVPVKDDSNKVVGCIVLGKSLETSSELKTIANTLYYTLEKISSEINDLSTAIQKVLNMNIEISTQVQEAEKSSKNTDDILKFIQGISAQTNMLGLNAAIEASRAGEAGKGFNVVAKEIRKLSGTTSESIKKIDDVLKNIVTLINSIHSKINESNEIFQAKATVIEQIAVALQELNSSAHKLNNLSKKL